MSSDADTRIVIDVPNKMNGVQEIVFNGEHIPINIKKISEIVLRITADSPFPQLVVTHLGIQDTKKS